MSTNIDPLKDWWWLWTTFGGLLVSIIILLIRLYIMYRQFKRLMRDNQRLFKCNFVILDGLKKLGCNGKVTEEYERMRQHVLDERGYEDFGGRR